MSMTLMPPRRSLRLAHAEFWEGLLSWRLWLRLGIHDIRIRYRRTYLGPFWITLSTSANFIAFGMLFSAVLKNDVTHFLPYLAGGLVSWTAINAMAGEGPQIFLDAQNVINSLRVPLTVHVLRCLVRNAVIFLHSCLAAIAALLILGGKLSADHLLLLVSVPLFLWVLFAGTLILSILGARFRDLGPIVTMGMQFVFFVTPIIWTPDDLPLARKWWVGINPAYHLIEIVRQPLLGRAPAPVSWMVATGSGLLLGMAAYGLFCLFRRRIAYWL